MQHNNSSKNENVFENPIYICGAGKGTDEDQFEFNMSSKEPQLLNVRSSAGAKRADHQVAFETNSSIGSENCSLDSINVSMNDNQRSGATNRRSFWGYFFKTQE